MQLRTLHTQVRAEMLHPRRQHGGDLTVKLMSNVRESQASALLTLCFQDRGPRLLHISVTGKYLVSSS